MKKYLYALLALSATATLALSCEKEMEVAEDVDNAGSKLVNISIPVEIEAIYNPEDAETRTQYSDDFSTFGWTSGDQIRMPVVKKTAGKITDCDFFTFTTSDPSGSAEATFIRNNNTEALEDFDPNPGLADNTWTNMGYLVYPADFFNKEHSGDYPVVNLPTAYDVDMTAPLNGKVVTLIGRKDGEKYKFSSAVGILKVTLDNAPGDLSAVRLVSTGKPVAGKFAVSDVTATVAQITNVSATEGAPSITLNATGLTEGETYSFYFPLPVGNYEARTLKLQVIHKTTLKQDEVLLEQTISKGLKIQRNQLMEVPSLLYHRVYVKHNNPSEPWLHTVKPAAANRIFVHVTQEKLTPDTYDHSVWKSGNCFSNATGDYNIASLTDNGGRPFLSTTGNYYLQFIVSADGSIPSALADKSVLAFGSVPFYYHAANTKLAPTAEMLNVPYVSTSEGAVANLVDGNMATYWHSPYGSEDPARNATYGQIISIDLGAENTVGSFDFFFATRTCLNDHAKALNIYTSSKRWDEEGATLTQVGSTTDALKFLRPYANASDGEWVEAIPCTATKAYRYITISIVGNSSNDDLRTTGCTHMAEMALYQTSVLEPASGDEPDAIDLGLSVKWASFNVGATTPTQCGDYYAWGEVKTKTNYSWAKYKWSNDGTTTQITKYVTKSDYAYLGATDGKVTLDPEDDIANVKYGGDWRMPTLDEWKELISSCSKTWVLDNGMWGWRFTASNGNSIFLPAAGGYNLAKLESVGTYDNEEDCSGFYWSSTLLSSSPDQACYVEFCLDWVETTYAASRARGFSVRAVLPVASPSVDVTSVELDQTDIELEFYGKQLLTATVLPNNATDPSVTWTSSDESVVLVSNGSTFDAMGNITPAGTVIALNKEGEATVTATAGGKSASCKVTVVAPATTLPDPAPDGSVNLGLSVYWATSNLSESGLCVKPQDYGDYYAWGEVSPHYSSLEPKEWKENLEGYYTSTYKWYQNGNKNKVTKYCSKLASWAGEGDMDYKTVLDREDDPAFVILKNKWRMPTETEWQELVDGCNWVRTDNYAGTGICGVIGTSKVSGFEGRTIFLPACGNFYGTSLPTAGSFGWYWASTTFKDYPAEAACGVVSNSGIQVQSHDRFYGFAIRPVCTK